MPSLAQNLLNPFWSGDCLSPLPEARQGGEPRDHRHHLGGQLHYRTPGPHLL